MAAKKARTWRCQRVRAGVKCATDNPRIKQKCTTCGGPRPKASRPAHMAALDEMTYEQAVALFGERCGICDQPPKRGKKLQRDHEHKGDGWVRGLLCFQCNILLKDEHTIAWMRRALAYLLRAEERKQAW